MLPGMRQETSGCGLDRQTFNLLQVGEIDASSSAPADPFWVTTHTALAIEVVGVSTIRTRAQFGCVDVCY
jgi:hypothetical protein